MMTSPGAIVVSALPVRGTEAFGAAEKVFTQNGVQLLPPPGVDLRGPSDYQADMASWARKDIAATAERYRPVIERSGALVLVNDVPETITDRDGQPVCQVPFGVSRFAIALARIATEVYGDRKGVFLSHSYPDISELSSAPQTPRVVKARTRQLSLYEFRPIALLGNYSRLAEIGREARK